MIFIFLYFFLFGRANYKIAHRSNHVTAQNLKPGPSLGPYMKYKPRKNPPILQTQRHVRAGELKNEGDSTIQRLRAKQDDHPSSLFHLRKGTPIRPLNQP